MMPVEIDWPKRERLASLTATYLQHAFARERAVLLIHGEGGAGKTSLACQIARWAMTEDKVSRISPNHYMLPIIIEYDLNIFGNAKQPSLVDIIRGQLTALIGTADPVPEGLLLRLLKRRRLLLIVDRFSELSTATRDTVRPGNPDFPINALVVTSRINEPLDGVPKTTIMPLRVEGNRLSTFMESYLLQCGKRDLFLDSEYFESCSRLSMIVGRRNVTVLLAKLYVEQMIASKESSSQTQLPSNIPDLMLNYLNELNCTRSQDEPNDRTVHRAAKTIAWECLREEYRPTIAPRDRVLAALRDEADPPRILNYLESRLKAVRTLGSGRDQIGFTLDPLAEYLAALRVVEQCASNSTAWREVLDKANLLQNASTTISSFLLAVLDCCASKQQEIRVAESVRAELESMCTTEQVHPIT